MKRKGSGGVTPGKLHGLAGGCLEAGSYKLCPPTSFPSSVNARLTHILISSFLLQPRLLHQPPNLAPIPTLLSSPMSLKSRRHPSLCVWMVTMNREVTREEFQRCMQCLDPGLRKEINKSNRQDSQTLRQIISLLLPRMLMVRNRIPRSRWSFESTDYGKSYIDSPELGNKVKKVVGYNVACEGSVVAMAFAYGRKHQVVNIGMEVMKMPGRGIRVQDFVESHLHKLAPSEESFIVPALNDDVILRRLCLILALKEAYIKALGQPPGFDLARIECNIPHSISVDGTPVLGWEFRLFRANLGVMRRNLLHEESYQCVCAIYRGWDDRTEFHLGENPSELKSWLQFITVETVTKCASAIYTGSEGHLMEER